MLKESHYDTLKTRYLVRCILMRISHNHNLLKCYKASHGFGLNRGISSEISVFMSI